MKCNIAVDIGASSGRVIASYLENGRMVLKELYRFPNQLVHKNGQLCWDIEKLFTEIKVGIKKSTAFNLEPLSIGVDTWAVDFVLLNENVELLTDAVSYRDHRTDGMMEKVFQVITQKELYESTGIQFQQFNTVYQLFALKMQNPSILKKAKSLLMIPDYIHFLLTGKKFSEYTNASTTQLVSAHSRNWDETLIDQMGFNKELFQEIIPPATLIGYLKPELVEEFGFNMKVIAPATHDTGSAVLAVPSEENSIYLSSGTWSLIGVENTSPICHDQALSYNFTNEGSINGNYRFLKNIMGLWLIQEVKRLHNANLSFDELVSYAKKNASFPSIIDVNDDRFLSPESMTTSIQTYCQETNQQIPYEIGELVSCIYNSLADGYRKAVIELEELTDQVYASIYVIGGGSQNDYLNQALADATNKSVFAGPAEASAIGNIVAQLISLGELKSIQEARNLVKDSFGITQFVPK